MSPDKLRRAFDAARTLVRVGLALSDAVARKDERAVDEILSGPLLSEIALAEERAKDIEHFGG